MLCRGLAAGAILLGLVVAEHRRLALKSKAVLLVGAVPYAVYPLHPIVLGQPLRFPPNQPPLNWLACAVAVVATAGVARAFHRLVEQPLLRPRCAPGWAIDCRSGSAAQRSAADGSARASAASAPLAFTTTPPYLARSIASFTRTSDHGRCRNAGAPPAGRQCAARR